MPSTTDVLETWINGNISIARAHIRAMKKKQLVELLDEMMDQHGEDWLTVRDKIQGML